ncbi:MAG: YvcK family protein [Actinomycetia bacterium]|nr:YvcK family protein [Actinomycetes bacterium]
MKENAKVVGIGGGTGLSTLLKGIKQWTGHITAIVTVTDDGGSSGRLRKDFNILPPGDIRNCLVSLADSRSLLPELFQYRFRGNSNLSGHSFGNLMIAALSELTGSFAKGLLEVSQILNIQGRVLPSTLENVILGAEFNDGKSLLGQTRIVGYRQSIKKVFLQPSSPQAYKGVIKACREAELIVLGPGSLFSSIIPNLLVRGVAEAIRESKAKKVYICNIMTQPGETDGFKAGDHVRVVENYLGCELDYILIDSSKIPDSLTNRHAESNSFKVVDDLKHVQSGTRIIREELFGGNQYIRHDPARTAEIIFKKII